MRAGRGARRSAALRSAVALSVTALFVIAPGGAARTEVITATTIGYDSFIDRFSILEEDTAEAVHDFYAGLRNSFSHRSNALRLGLFNFFRFGNQTIDEDLDGELTLSPGAKTRVDLRSAFHWKQFRPGSDYTYGNDYLQSNTSLRVKRTIGRESSISLKQRFEIVDYDERTDFDYDYRYIDGGLEGELGSYFSRFLRCSAVIGFKEAPDTTELSYRRTLAEVELQLASRRWTTLHLLVIGDRRDYRGTVRSPYWNVFSYADLSLGASGGTTLSLRLDSELTIFDEPTSTYFDSHFIRAGVRIKRPIRGTSAASVEPRYARMFCGDFPEERYWEGSVVLGADIMGNETFWTMCSFEPGYRDYTAPVNELYSDFSFFRTSLLGTLSLPGSFALNLFVSHDPEHHTRRDDDFSITLVSLDLTKRF